MTAFEHQREIGFRRPPVDQRRAGAGGLWSAAVERDLSAPGVVDAERNPAARPRCRRGTPRVWCCPRSPVGPSRGRRRPSRCAPARRARGPAARTCPPGTAPSPRRAERRSVPGTRVCPGSTTAATCRRLHAEREGQPALVERGRRQQAHDAHGEHDREHDQRAARTITHRTAPRRSPARTAAARTRPPSTERRRRRAPARRQQRETAAATAHSHQRDQRQQVAALVERSRAADQGAELGPVQAGEQRRARRARTNATTRQVDAPPGRARAPAPRPRGREREDREQRRTRRPGTSPPASRTRAQPCLQPDVVDGQVRHAAELLLERQPRQVELPQVAAELARVEGGERRRSGAACRSRPGSPPGGRAPRAVASHAPDGHRNGEQAQRDHARGRARCPARRRRSAPTHSASSAAGSSA